MTTAPAARPASGFVETATGPWPPVTIVLSVTAFAILAMEYVREHVATDPSLWTIAEAAVAAAGLLAAWRLQSELRLIPLLLVAALFHLCLVALHVRLGVPGDNDVNIVYAQEGNQLLDGDYPSSPYPPGAVLLFGLDAWLGDGAIRTPHAFLMVPFNVLLIASVWSFRTATSAWLAAVAALAPSTVFFWEYRFDLVPASLLVLALALAWHDRWLLSAAVLGTGTWVKWTPALAAVALVAWLVVRGADRRLAVRFGLTFFATILVLHAPFLVWSADEVIDPLIGQGERGLTGESLPYIPLRVLGLAELNGNFWDEAVYPAWANRVAVVVQLALLAALCLSAAMARARSAALALAALVPATFLLTNRIFSPQFLVVIAAGWLVAAALVIRTRREQLLVGALTAIALALNALVYPDMIGRWLVASAGLFMAALALTTLLVIRAIRVGIEPSGQG
jgi:hypothetical protein